MLATGFEMGNFPNSACPEGMKDSNGKRGLNFRANQCPWTRKGW